MCLAIVIIKMNDHIMAGLNWTSAGKILLIGPWNICGYSLKIDIYFFQFDILILSIDVLSHSCETVTSGESRKTSLMISKH